MAPTSCENDTPAKEKIIVALERAGRGQRKPADGRVGRRGRMGQDWPATFHGRGPVPSSPARGSGGFRISRSEVHDIPNTAAEAVRSACKLGVDMTTIHLSGGGAMIAAAFRAAEDSPALVLGVKRADKHGRSRTGRNRHAAQKPAAQVVVSRNLAWLMGCVACGQARRKFPLSVKACKTGSSSSRPA